MDTIKLQDESQARFKFAPLSLSFLKNSQIKQIRTDFSYLTPWLLTEKKRFLRSFVFFIFATIATLSLPKMIGYIVDEGLVHKNWSEFKIIVSFLILSISKIFFDIAYKWNLLKAGQLITLKLREDMYTEFNQKPLSFFDQNNSGKIMSRVVSDINNLASFFTTNIFSIFSDIILILGALILVFLISPYSGFIILLALSFLFIYMTNVTLAMMDWSKESRQLLSRINSSTTDSLNNLSILHTSKFNKTWQNRNTKLQNLFGKNTKRVIFIWGTFSSAHVFIMGISMASIIWISFYQLQNESISYGQFVAILSYVLMCFNPFLDISDKMNVFLTALSSVFRLKEILPHRAHNSVNTETEKDISLNGSIEINHLSFSYNQKDLVLSDVSFTIQEGEITALAGRSGSGKSTLVQLILGFYPVDSNSLNWGEVDMNTISKRTRSEHIGFVSQDLFFFQDTLRENIRLYDESISDTDLFSILEMIKLKDKILGLSNGLDTIYSEENLSFSQGEKQLLTIARLWLKKPKLLIFDEATAHLDQETEKNILDTLHILFKGKTILFIAHRLQSLTMCHKVVVLKAGRLDKIIKKNPGDIVKKGDL